MNRTQAKLINLLLLNIMNPEQGGGVLVEASVKRGMLPAEIISRIDLLVAATMKYLQKSKENLRQEAYDLALKVVMNSFDQKDYARMIKNYQRIFRVKVTDDVHAANLLESYSPLDKLALFIGIKPPGLSDDPELVSGFLMKLLSLDVRYNIFDAHENRE